jgi:hypothetical protein
MPSAFGVLAASALLLSGAVPLQSQLRPYEPFDWGTLDPSGTLTVSLGTAVLWNQRASLAGTDGRLAELGTLQAFLTTGRVVLEAGGTLYRVFREDAAFADPTGGAEGHPLGTRRDAGDYRVSTTVLVAGRNRSVTAVLRFGSRLPTTDNRVGLERDALDFFALAGGKVDRGPFRATLELGVGIHGTRLQSFEQSDVLVYIFGLTTRNGPVIPTVLLLGHADALDRTIRGNEKLSEARLRVRSSGRTWVQVEAIRGLADASPDYGVTLAVGRKH